MIIKPYKILNEEWKLLRERTRERSKDLSSLDKMVLKLARPLAPIVHNLPKKVAIASMVICTGLLGRDLVGGIYHKIHENRSNRLAELVEFYDDKEGVSEEDSGRYSEAYERLPTNLKRYFNKTVKNGEGVKRIADGWLNYDEVKHLLEDYEQGQRE